LENVTYVNKGGRDDDASAELLQDNEDNIEFTGHHLVEEDRTKDTEGTCGQNDEEETDTETNVIISSARLTSRKRRSRFRLASLRITVTMATSTCAMSK
jgi:hypothetical protein